MNWPKKWYWQKMWERRQPKRPCCNGIASRWAGIGEIVHSKARLVARFEARAEERASGSWSVSVTLPGVWYFAVVGAKSRAHAMRVLRFAAEGKVKP